MVLWLVGILAVAGDVPQEGEEIPIPGLEPVATPRLTRELLDTSIALTVRYMLANQMQEGDFLYEYNIETREPTADNNHVRQAGALWGLSLAHRYQPSLITQKALRSGFAHFVTASVSMVNKGRMVAMPDERMGRTGLIALLLLAHIETIAADDQMSDGEVNLYKEYARQYLTFLMRMRQENGLFHAFYTYADHGTPRGLPSPYYDGESLLALIRVARVLKLDALKPIILESAGAMWREHVVAALRQDPVSETTKSFYQWGCLAFFEIHDAGWDEDGRLAKAAIDLSKWMLQRHRVLERERNTAYAFEGLVVSWELARRTGADADAELLRQAIDQGLHELISWQVGGPRENDYLQGLRIREPIAVGGFLNHPAEPLLRIDVAQHQLHAMILARHFLFPQTPR